MFDESISAGKLFKLLITYCVKKLEQIFNLAYGLNSFWPLVFVVAAGVKKAVGLIS